MSNYFKAGLPPANWQMATVTRLGSPLNSDRISGWRIVVRLRLETHLPAYVLSDSLDRKVPSHLRCNEWDWVPYCFPGQCVWVQTQTHAGSVVVVKMKLNEYYAPAGLLRSHRERTPWSFQPRNQGTKEITGLEASEFRLN